jgi:hypothetical protein
MPPRHILIFGSTSPLGLAFCLAALRDSHTLTLYIRNASKLPASISSSPSVTTIVGDLANVTALETAVSCGAATCVSFLGPVLSNLKKGHRPVTNGYELIVPLLCKYDYTRVLITSTASYSIPEDRFSLWYALIVWSVYLFFRPAFEEINGFTPLVVGLPLDAGLKWTVFRVPVLVNGETRTVKAGYLGDVGIKAERKGVAEWVMREMEEEQWVGKCPAVANA